MGERSSYETYSTWGQMGNTWISGFPIHRYPEMNHACAISCEHFVSVSASFVEFTPRGVTQLRFIQEMGMRA